MALSQLQLKFFADFIQQNLGIIYSEQNYFQLEQRLEKIAQSVAVGTAQELYTKCAKEGIAGDLKQLILDTATNNETLFYRDPKVFKEIEDFALPRMQKNRQNGIGYRIWCAASSFGQEPYSMAILVHEFAKKNPGHPRIELRATDIADHALARAKAGKYTQLEVQRGLPAIKLAQYFEPAETGFWKIKDEIRFQIQYQKQNLLDSFAGLGLFDIILCRYVLIYQDNAKKKEILSRLAKALVPGGLLVLGASESAMGLCPELDQLVHNGVIFYQNKS